MSTILRALALLTLLGGPAAGAPTIRVAADASEAPRHILHARLVIPVKAGPLELVYPKWIPGEHAPAGPIAGMAGLRITARGQTVPWRRDDEEMFAFHLEVPAGATELEVSFDF